MNQYLTYAPGSPERKRLKEVLAELKKEQIDVPCISVAKKYEQIKKEHFILRMKLPYTWTLFMQEMKNM